MAILGPSLVRVVFIAEHSTSSRGNIATFARVWVAENEIKPHPSFRVEQLLSQRAFAWQKCIQTQVRRRFDGETRAIRTSLYANEKTQLG